jgi:hypothetical protein
MPIQLVDAPHCFQGIHSVMRLFRTSVMLLIAGVAAGSMIVETAHPAVASATYGVTGYDISWPQCQGKRPPPPFDIAVVGVTDGHGFSGNPCLASEFTWSQQATHPGALYVNVDLPSATPSQGQTGPAGTCASGDVSCFAYNYGFNNSQYAIRYATSQGVDARVWWLDVETNNYWQASSGAAPAYRTDAPATPAAPAAASYNTAANARAIEGSIAGLTASNRVAGAYSTRYQWNLIAGGFAPQVPVWYATVETVSGAPRYCDQSNSFTGGPIWMVQYNVASGNPGYGFDGDYACTTQAGWRPIAGIHLATVDTAGHGASAVAINDNRIYVRPNTGGAFGAMVAASTEAFYGGRGTLFARLDGAGAPESAVAINDSSIWVMKNSGGSFAAATRWSSAPFYGTRDTVLANLDGTGYPSAVAINDDSIWVMRMNSTHDGFNAPQRWSSAPFSGSRGTFIADLDGHGQASAVAVNDSSVWVMSNGGAGFAAPHAAASAPFYGTRGVYVADLDGHGMASVVAINDSTIWVEHNDGHGGLSAPARLSAEPFYGDWQYLADVDGSGRASAVAVSSSGIWVKANQNGQLGASTRWFAGPYYGTH